nr:hypothetical protein Iba_chr08dCG7400 [Ipomoea batatas]
MNDGELWFASTSATTITAGLSPRIPLIRPSRQSGRAIIVLSTVLASTATTSSFSTWTKSSLKSFRSDRKTVWKQNGRFKESAKLCNRLPHSSIFSLSATPIAGFGEMERESLHRSAGIGCGPQAARYKAGSEMILPAAQFLSGGQK